MITVHASDAHPQFRQRHVALDGSTVPAVVLWDDPTVALAGSVSELRRLLTDALHTLPIVIEGTDPS